MNKRKERGRQGGYAGAGGKCICPNCGYVTSHIRSNPCFTLKCPECGAKLTRKR